MSRSTRLLRLLQAMRGRRRPVTAATLAAELEVSERTIYRDVADRHRQPERTLGRRETIFLIAEVRQ